MEEAVRVGEPVTEEAVRAGEPVTGAGPVTGAEGPVMGDRRDGPEAG